MEPEPQLPSVAAQVGGTPQLNVALPAAATAAGVVSQGTADLSQATAQASDVLAQNALRMAAMDNKTAADTAFSTNLQSANEYIDKFQADNVGFDEHGNVKAVANLPQALKDLESQRAQIGGQLETPMAKMLYEQDSRRVLSYMEGDLSKFANAQRVQSTLKQNQAVTGQLIDDTVAHPDHMVGNFAQIDTQLAAQGAMLGWSHAEYIDAVTKTHSAAISDITQGMADNDNVPGALAFFTAHKDDMTGADQAKIAGYLKRVSEPIDIANTVDTILGKYAAPSNVGPAASAPFQGTHSWNAGTTYIKGDPTGALSQLAGGPVQVYGGARTPAQNAAVGGSPTSEHLSGNAWDFSAAPGKTLEQTAATVAGNLHEQGIPFDQIEVDHSNNHVHVGFGPKSRNEIIDQNGKSLNGGPQGLPSQTGDPLSNLQNNLPSILAQVDAAYPGPENAARREQAEQRVLAAVGRVKTAQDAQYAQTSDRLLTALADPSVDSLPALQKAYPGAASDLASLPQGSSYWQGIQRGMKANANQVTPERLDIRSQLDGEIANDPKGFADKGPGYILGMDIPPAWQKDYIDKQAKIASKNAAVSNPSINHALSVAPVAEALKAANIRKGTDDYNQFTGSLMGEIEHFVDVHGRKPNDKDLMNISGELLARQNQTMELPGGLFGVTWQSQGQQAFRVPDESRQAIIEQFRKLKGFDPNSQTVSEIYWSTHAR